MAAAKSSIDRETFVSVKKFKEQYINILKPEDIGRKDPDAGEQHFASEMGVSLGTLEELQNVCSSDNLKCPAEPEDMENYDITSGIPAGAADLLTLKYLKDRRGKLTDSKREINYLMKEVGPFTNSEQFKEVQQPEVLLSAAIHHPRTLIKVQEFLVLGSQPLTALRDKIYCVADHVVPGDHSNQPDLSNHAKARDICRSGFFFIEGVFYNDLRDALCRDYSRVIIDWAEDKRRQNCEHLRGLRKKRMETSLFDELQIRLGYPYVYCHQGNCEHLVIFTDLRMLGLDDSQNSLDYPVQVFKHRGRRRRCKCCEIYTARWVTTNDAQAVEEPCFFCDRCFKSLHYSSDGQKLTNFEAYPYMGNFSW